MSISWRVGRRPARRLAVAYLLPGRQAGLLQLPERIVDGAEGGAAAGDSAADRLGGLAGTGVAERPQHPLWGVGQGGGRVGDPGDGGVVGAMEVVAGQLGPGSGRDAVATAGSGEDQRAWGAAVGELAGDGVGDLAGERDDADAGGALGPVLVAAAELASLVADLEDLQAPGGEVDPVGAQAEQLPGAEPGPDQADEVVAVEGQGAGEQPPELLGGVGPSLGAAEAGVGVNRWPRGRDFADGVGVDAPVVLGRLEDAVEQRPAGHHRVVADLCRVARSASGGPG